MLSVPRVPNALPFMRCRKPRSDAWEAGCYVYLRAQTENGGRRLERLDFKCTQGLTRSPYIKHRKPRSDAWEAGC